jgi:hypothetical protein
MKDGRRKDDDPHPSKNWHFAETDREKKYALTVMVQGACNPFFHRD